MKLIELSGIGEKTAALFEKINVFSVEDLIKLYPRNYDIFEKPLLVSEIDSDCENSTIAVDAVISGRVETFNNGRISVLSTVVRDSDNNGIKVTWFNMPFLKNQLKKGMRYVFRGHIAYKNGIRVLEQPEIYTVAKYNEIEGQMLPVYPLTKGLSNKIVIKAVSQALSKYKTGLEPEYIPAVIREKNSLAEHNFAVVNIHFPGNFEDYIISRKRLAFEEFFLFVLAIRMLKISNERLSNDYIIENDRRTDEFIANLPYDLTDAQKKTWEEIKINMRGKGLMNRLVQGDVGSGKTIIAVLSMMNTVFAGYQAALMAPTEVLAKQHFDSVCSLFEKYNIDIKVALLVGSMTTSQKRETYQKIERGEISIIIGTHALIQDRVVYNNLGLVITDEQHRFGVNQRKNLSDKGKNPHILVMSATPIPRTLAIIVYGDLDISVIDELPANRLPVKNCVVDESYRGKAYSFITNQVHEGRQVYIICPMVEESENIEAENVIDYTKKLENELPKDIKISYLHGKMKAAEKNSIMTAFSKNEINVLVSTTVIEVGVNVPNATVMMVENADRFGLAQLHQLRGRVGRGKHQSYCIFMSDKKNKKTKERLEILNKTNDGFVIAEEDLKLRGPGDFFGVRQSGEMDFGIADIYTDAKVLKASADAANMILEEDPMLEKNEHLLLKNKVSEYIIKCLSKLNI